MDGKGNIYVADTSNLAIRKIGESGDSPVHSCPPGLPCGNEQLTQSFLSRSDHHRRRKVKRSWLQRRPK